MYVVTDAKTERVPMTKTQPDLEVMVNFKSKPETLTNLLLIYTS